MRGIIKLKNFLVPKKDKHKCKLYLIRDWPRTRSISHIWQCPVCYDQYIWNKEDFKREALGLNKKEVSNA